MNRQEALRNEELELYREILVELNGNYENDDRYWDSLIDVYYTLVGNQSRDCFDMKQLLR